MKTLISLLLLCITTSLQLCSQNSACDKVFNAYSGKKGISTINFSGNLINFMFDDEKKEGNCKITSVKILYVEDSLKNSGYNFYKEIVPKLNKNDYEELIKVKKTGQDMVIYCKKDKKRITEFILVSGGKENALVYINGSLSLADCKRVSKDININYDFDEMEQKIQD
jgi:hypothetical protein